MIIKNITDSYKQTDWGIIPKDWNYEILQGKIVIVHGFGFQSQYFNSQGLYRLTTPGHFYEEGGFRDVGEKQKYYDGPLPDGYLLRSKDLIVAMTEQADGLLGSAAIIPESGNYLHNQRLGKVKPISSDIEIDFLYYIFNSKKFRLKVRETAAGTKVKHTSPNKLLEIAVPIPPPPEQKAIAQSLSDVDALITECDRIITKKRNTKQGMMQQLLTGKKRLPDFSKDGDRVVMGKKTSEGYKQTEVGMIPNDWEVVLLDSVAKRGSGHTPDKKHPEYWNGEIKWISLKDSNLLDNLYIDNTAEKITPAGIANSSAVLHPSGSVVLSRDAGVGKSAITKDVMAVSQHFMAWHCGSQLNNHFLYYWLQTEKSEFERIAIGNTIKTIGLSYFKQLKIPFPSLPEQKAIAQILKDMDTEIAALEQKRDKYKAVKQGMMQELLTGTTRLKYDLNN
ncbi:MAG: restriction endonuclease subunit S [Nostoc sp. JL23]|uniref:restriction endonuclease subunit S n=1 Tax=uncultured Nostoc sp. TaxID=340711 RepID=UPI001DA9E7A2|nr:restriction endonuclease subunit S [Nostoc sp. JL23]